MTFATLRWAVGRYPGRIAVGWLLLTLGIGLLSPNLTQLAAEGQAHLLNASAESAIADRDVHEQWPDRWFESLAVVALVRDGGLTKDDHAYADRLDRAFQAMAEPPESLLRVIGPTVKDAEVAERLITPDRTTQTILLQLSESFVAPSTGRAVTEFQEVQAALPPPDGLKVLWTGDAVIGRDYMARVKESLDRAAFFTVFLLLIVLLIVYRSFLLAMIPLLTIGAGVVISRAVLAWLVQVGWEVSPLVELFLIVILFGCGTDFCLFLSWRFGEHWDPSDPAGAMRITLKRTITALLTSAGTVIAGLSLMRVTKFKLFATTGPSVALGLALTLAACLTLTPAMLVLLAKRRPKSFAGLTAPPSGVWNDIARRVMKRPLLSWLATIAVMGGPVLLSLTNERPYVQDTFSEMPADTESVVALKAITDPPYVDPPRKYRLGELAPLTVVLKREDGRSWQDSQGLAVIDDLSQMLDHLPSLLEVRSATQPLGSAEPLERARLSGRLGEINEGFRKIASGAKQLEDGLVQGAAKLRTAMMFEHATGLNLLGGKKPADLESDPVNQGLKEATASMFGLRPRARPAEEPEKPAPPAGPQDQMLRELSRAADGARQIAEGASRADDEVAIILQDPVGVNALDRLLITRKNIEENPDLNRSFRVYISPDGMWTRFDLVQAERLFSAAALDQVSSIRRRINEYLGEERHVEAKAFVTGPNAQSFDIREMTRRDQYVTWVVVPVGVFFILLLALRDGWACVNLVVTMIWTYCFAMGVTHAVFVDLMGHEGIDWKVPYFLFVLLVAVGVDYNVFLMTRVHEEVSSLGLKAGITRAVAQTGGLISSAAMITACSFASFLSSPLSSIRQLGFALVVGILVDAVLVRPVLVPCGHWLLSRPAVKTAKKKKAPLPRPENQLIAVGD